MLSEKVFTNFKKWEAPYHFVVGRILKWDPSQIEILHVNAHPSTAYVFYAEVLSFHDNNPLSKATYDVFLHDSYHKDAVEFCKIQYERSLGITSCSIKESI